MNLFAAAQHSSCAVTALCRACHGGEATPFGSRVDAHAACHLPGSHEAPRGGAHCRSELAAPLLCRLRCAAIPVPTRRSPCQQYAPSRPPSWFPLARTGFSWRRRRLWAWQQLIRSSGVSCCKLRSARLLSTRNHHFLTTYLRPEWPRVVLLGVLLFIGIGLQLANPQIAKPSSTAPRPGNHSSTWSG